MGSCGWRIYPGHVMTLVPGGNLFNIPLFSMLSTKLYYVVVCDAYFLMSDSEMKEVIISYSFLFCYVFVMTLWELLPRSLCCYFPSHFIGINQWFVIFVFFIWEVLWVMCLWPQSFISVSVHQWLSWVWHIMSSVCFECWNLFRDDIIYVIIGVCIEPCWKYHYRIIPTYTFLYQFCS